MFQTGKDVSAGPDELELIDLARQGNQEAFTTLYHCYLQVVYNRVRCLIPPADVEDVTQEVFIALLKSLKHFKGQSRLTTWLHTLTNRRIADYYRRRGTAEHKHDMNLDGADDRLQLHAPSFTSTLDEQITLREALLDLPEDYREVILMRFAEDLPFKEIARLRGQSLEAVKSLFRRSIEALRHRMDKSV